MDIAQAALICIAVFLGGVVSGFAGFAFAAPAGAILAFAFPPSAAVPLLFLCGLLNQSLSIWTLRAKMKWKSSAPFLLGGLVGLPLGLVSLSNIGTDIFRHAFGLFLISYSIVMLVRPACVDYAKRSGPIVSAAVGVAGGVIGGFTAMPGALPAVWLDMQGSDKDRKRGTLQPFIFGMQLLSLPIMFATKSFSINPWMVVVAVPALLLGTRTGVSLFGRLSDGAFRTGTLSLLTVSGVLLAV